MGDGTWGTDLQNPTRLTYIYILNMYIYKYMNLIDDFLDTFRYVLRIYPSLRIHLEPSLQNELRQKVAVVPGAVVGGLRGPCSAEFPIPCLAVIKRQFTNANTVIMYILCIYCIYI